MTVGCGVAQMGRVRVGVGVRWGGGWCMHGGIFTFFIFL